MPSAVVASIGLGANLGEPQAALEQALEALAALPGTKLIATSPFYRSAPIDAAGPDFINAVALLRTELGPHALLAHLQRIEVAQGRVRPYRHAPRTLDLDLLLYGDARIDEADLTIPHPRMHERAFVLRPLADVAPDAVIPGLGRVADWLPHVADQKIFRN
ncbi:MAG TPA: 2-amino-4-hydroxy-6-hydroxymethyldihydropteridine diphosphokinase [Albitalea sp.]|nr:2-amino-4-hydroxy-6-hydroxymethyldihydropteridine diphosphokinase [Albitalea sp.]